VGPYHSNDRCRAIKEERKTRASSTCQKCSRSKRKSFIRPQDDIILFISHIYISDEFQKAKNCPYQRPALMNRNDFFFKDTSAFTNPAQNKLRVANC
jgi:hypothetical protein